MKLNIKNLLAGILLVPVLAFASGVAIAPLAGALTAQQGADAAQGSDQTITDLDTDTGLFKTITNTLLYLIGAVSVIMIVFGGVRYVISGGDATQVTAAKNTILYAVVGLVIALLAYALINFVLTSIQ